MSLLYHAYVYLEFLILACTIYILAPDALCHGNWIEIERKTQYIQTLQAILDDNHIPYPTEFD